MHEAAQGLILRGWLLLSRLGLLRGLWHIDHGAGIALHAGAWPFVVLVPFVAAG